MTSKKWHQDSFTTVKWWLPILMFMVYFIIETIIQEVSHKIIIWQDPSLAGDSIASIIQLNTYPWYFLILHATWIVIFIWILDKLGMTFFKQFSIKNIDYKVIAYGFLTITLAQQILSMLSLYLDPEQAVSLNQEILNQSALTMPGWKMIIVFAILPSIIEEVLVRGLIMRYMLPNKSIIAMILSSIVFASMHLTLVPIHALLYFIMGLILALIYWRTGKIENAIIVHFLNNFLAVLGMIYLN